MPARNFLVKIISTFFYAGFFPLIPGTFASLVGIFLFYLVKDNTVSYISLTLVLLAVGFWASNEAEKLFNKKDASVIVIDEVAGMLLSLIFIPYDIRLVIAGFFLFRIFDTLKPYPACSLQKLKGGLGVMSDDIVAALYTNIVLQVVLRLASFRAW